MIKINNWSLTQRNCTPYNSPEHITAHLIGDAINHPKLGAKFVKTSAIVNVKGRIVYTESGSIYKLGYIDPGYRKWMKKNYPKWDWKTPIIMKEM